MRRNLRQTLTNGRFGDIHPSRSDAMRRIKSSGNKSTEVAFQMAMVRARMRGWSSKTHDTIGRPDFLFRKEQVAVFIDGCFWHGCQQCSHAIHSRTEFWRLKIATNLQRDQNVNRRLRKMGFLVVRVREHSLRQQPGQQIAKVLRALEISNRKGHSLTLRRG